MRAQLLILLVAAVGTPALADDKPAPLLWEARGKKGVRIFLLGTIPVTDPRLHKLAPPCEQAYQLATSVYTEDGGGWELEEVRAEARRRAVEKSRVPPPVPQAAAASGVMTTRVAAVGFSLLRACA